MKFEWKYRYVPDGQLEPDKQNRWAVNGFIWADIKKSLPDFMFLIDSSKEGCLPVKVATIFQRGCVIGDVPSVLHQFGCVVPSLYDACGVGLVKKYYYGNTVEEVQKQVEEALNTVALIFSNAQK